MRWLLSAAGQSINLSLSPFIHSWSMRAFAGCSEAGGWQVICCVSVVNWGSVSVLWHSVG